MNNPCLCGCGGNAGFYSTAQRGYKIGEPRKFLKGHNSRIKEYTNGQFKVNGRSPRKGISVGVDHKTDCCCSVCRVKSGKSIDETHPAWQGGRTTIAYRIRATKKYAAWRNAILARDNFRCQKCFSTENLSTDHYPMGLSEIVYKNNIKKTSEALRCGDLWDLKNGRVLCLPCHRKTESWGNNKYYVKH